MGKFSSETPTAKAYKYLGIVFNDTYPHLSIRHLKLVKKLSRSVGILAKVQPFLNAKALLNSYYAIFHLHLQYRLIARSSTYKSFLKQFKTLQNKAVKIVEREQHLFIPN